MRFLSSLFFFFFFLKRNYFILFFFFFQAEDGIRDLYVTGVQTCALPILRAAVLRPLPRVPPEPRMPYRTARGLSPVAGNGVVRRGRCHRLFRVFGPLDHEIDPGREDPRRSVPTPDRRTATGWIPGGLALPRHAQWLSARRCGLTRPIKHLPGPAGPVHRTDPAACP